MNNIDSLEDSEKHLFKIWEEVDSSVNTIDDAERFKPLLELVKTHKTNDYFLTNTTLIPKSKLPKGISVQSIIEEHNDFYKVVNLIIKYDLLRKDIVNEEMVITTLALSKRFLSVRNAVAAIKHNKTAAMPRTIRFLQAYEDQLSRLNGYFEKEPLKGVTIRYSRKGKNRQLSKEEVDLLISTLNQTQNIHLSRLRKDLLAGVQNEEIEDAQWSLDFKSRNSFQKYVAQTLFQVLDEIAVNDEKAYLFIGEFMFLAGCPFYDNKGNTKSEFDDKLFRQHVKNFINRN